MNILVLHGPNLCFLGEREPEIYGKMTLAQINKKLQELAKKRGAKLRIVQENCEGKLIDHIFKNRRWAHGIVINPGAYTHYSFAIRDAVAASNVPTIEVHLTDIHKREGFRSVSVVEPVCTDNVVGKGWRSYTEGIEKLLAMGKKK